FVAMEHVDGQTLALWLETPRRWRDIVAVFAAAAHGLQAAHRLGLVHRDFKPENVLVAKDGRVLVGDFGLVGMAANARELPTRAQAFSTSRLTHDGAVVGTPGYIAPEIRAHKPADARADQYAFSVALGGALGKRGPRRIQRLIRRGLSEDPEARHPSMQT